MDVTVICTRANRIFLRSLVYLVFPSGAFSLALFCSVLCDAGAAYLPFLFAFSWLCCGFVSYVSCVAQREANLAHIIALDFRMCQLGVSYVLVLSECIISSGEGLCTPYSMYCILCAGEGIIMYTGP